MSAEVLYVIIAVGVVMIVVVSAMRGRMSKYEYAIARLENEKNALDAQAQTLQYEYDSVNSRVAELKGKLEEQKEGKAASRRMNADDALEQSQVRKEDFTDYLVRKGVVSPEQVAKVKAYKTSNDSAVSIPELLVMFDHVDGSTMTLARNEYNAALSAADVDDSEM